MGFDVNKIIMESIQEVIGDPVDKKEVAKESVVEDKKVEPVVETKIEAKVEDKKEEKAVTENIGDEAEYTFNTSPAVAAAIAAGLGALTLRKRLVCTTKKS